MRNTIFPSWRKHALVALTTIAVSVTAAIPTAGAAAEVTVSGRSREEVIDKWEQYKPTFNGDPFVEQPKLTPPHMPGKLKQAYEIFQGVLPQIVFSLQNMELFHHAEKRLLKARGVLLQTHVRDASLELDPKDAEHIDFLNVAILELLARLGMPAYPRYAA